MIVGAGKGHGRRRREPRPRRDPCAPRQTVWRALDRQGESNAVGQIVAIGPDRQAKIAPRGFRLDFFDRSAEPGNDRPLQHRRSDDRRAQPDDTAAQRKRRPSADQGPSDPPFRQDQSRAEHARRRDQQARPRNRTGQVQPSGNARPDRHHKPERQLSALAFQQPFHRSGERCDSQAKRMIAPVPAARPLC